jgi:tetratricopeptide (TPR) repeat protein
MDNTGPTPNPLDGDGQAERLSTQALAITFVGRRAEMEAAIDYLLPEIEPAGGVALAILGDSGTGKTFFARELMRRLFGARPNALYLYIDITNDEYQNSRSLESLLKTTLVAGPMTGTSTISVPQELSLQIYRRRTRERGFGLGLLRSIAQAVAAFMGVGSAINAALDQHGTDQAESVSVELTRYLAWVSKKEAVFVAVDNIQYLNLDMRLTIESVLQRVGGKVRFIAIDRTVDGESELDPPIRCFADDRLDIQLYNLTSLETRQLVAGAIGEGAAGIDRLATDIFTKTSGLAKDVEYCLRQCLLDLGRGTDVGAIEGLLSTIDRLPLIHREFLVIAALLDGGVKKDIACKTVRRLAAIYDEASLDDVIDELIAKDYLRVNSDSGDRLRPGHERIVTAIRGLADDELSEDVRRTLIDELASALETPYVDENEAYLLHCLVGLQTARELARNIHYISRLIQTQHRQDQFTYLVALTDELLEILPLLPEHVLNDLLDAMQKSSAFEQGLQVLRLLDSKSVPDSAVRRMYRFKYLTQAYRYEEALALSEELDDSEWRAVYQVNTLMALDRVEEARFITVGFLSEPLSESQAVLRRNTVTLFDPDTALQHLDGAYEYFERQQSEFRLATVDTNRGLVYLQMDRLGDALRCLERASGRMRHVGSREIYQAQVNLAVRSALLGNFTSALGALEEAALQVPRALLLDQVKISMNRTIIECLAGSLALRSAERSLIECASRFRGVEMPYMQRAIESNLATVRGDGSPEATIPSERVSLAIRVSPNGALVTTGPWTLLMSVHWRY